MKTTQKSLDSLNLTSKENDMHDTVSSHNKCVAPRFSFGAAAVAQFTLDFSDRIISPLLHRTIFIWSWRCLRAASASRNKSTKGFFLLCVSVCKSNCGYSHTFIGTIVCSPSVHKNERRMDLLTEVALGLGIIWACWTVRNLLYFSLLVQTARLQL